MDDKQLNQAIQIIGQTMTPEQVFTPEQLIQWAKDHMAPNDIYSLKDLKSTISDLKAEVI